jgi:adenine phosphoribosyltransferase
LTLVVAAARADDAVAMLPPSCDVRVAVLPRAAADADARARLRKAGVECVTTLDGGDLHAAHRLAADLAAALGWKVSSSGESAGPGNAVDVVGWYEVRIAHDGTLVTTDRPITRLQGSTRYIASFNLLGQGRLNSACADLLRRRLVDERVVPKVAFDTVVCAESKAVGLVQALVDGFGLDRYVVLRKGVKNYMPRRPRAPLVTESSSITTAGPQTLVLDPNDWPLVEHLRVLLVDDVIATGGTVRAAIALLERAGATVMAVAAVLLKGADATGGDVPRRIVLAQPLL